MTGEGWGEGEHNGNSSFEERGILYYKPSSFSGYLSGSTMGISKGVNIDAFGFSDSNILFPVDIPTTLDGVTYTERDLILYDRSNFSKHLDGAAIGIPNGARIDAATVPSDGSIVFSSDIPVSLGGIPFKALDLIRYDGSSLLVGNSMFLSLEHFYFCHCFGFRNSDSEFLTAKPGFSVKHYLTT